MIRWNFWVEEIYKHKVKRRAAKLGLKTSQLLRKIIREYFKGK